MIIDLNTVKDWLGLLALVVSLASTAYAVLAARRKDVDGKIASYAARLNEKIESNRAAIAALDRRMDRMDARQSQMEQTVAEMPKREDIHKVELQLSAMTGALGRIEAVMGGNNEIMKRLETIVSRHEDHLLTRS